MKACLSAYRSVIAAQIIPHAVRQKAGLIEDYFLSIYARLSGSEIRVEQTRAPREGVRGGGRGPGLASGGKLAM